MASNYTYDTLNGVIIPDTSALQAEVTQFFYDAFGTDIDVSDGSPASVLINLCVYAFTQVLNNNAQVANQINPNVAGGVWLADICALMGFKPQAATYSILSNVELSGSPSTLIYKGARAMTTDGNFFAITADTTLGPDGTGTADFQSVLPGSIPAPANTLTTIIDAVIGWQTVNNPNAAVLGQAGQSDQSIRKQRIQLLGKQGVGSVPACYSNAFTVPDVKNVKVLENYTNAPLTVENVNISANSIWACIQGGDDDLVAQKLLASKSAGCNWYNGASATPITKNVVDPVSGQTYVVKFDRPDVIEIDVRITIKVRGLTPGDIRLSVIQSIVDYSNGDINQDPGLQMGTPVSPFEIAGAVNINTPYVFVQSVEIKKSTDSTFVSTEIPIEAWQIATIPAGAINVVIS